MTQATTTPQQEAAAARRKLDAVAGVRRWFRRARMFLGALVLLLGVYAWMSYRLYTLPGSYNPKARTQQSPIDGIAPGDTLLLQNLNLWRSPKLGDVVLYHNPKPADGSAETLIGRIAGLPGETVRRTGPTMSVGGRDPLAVGFDLGSGSVADGDVIAADHYLILADNDNVPYLDSRNVGYVAESDIFRRVSLNITAWSGRPAPTP